MTAAVAGFALHLAYPRPGWDLVGWVALAPILYLAVSAGSVRQAMVEGWVGGGAFFVALLSWLTHTLTAYTALDGPVAVLVLALLSAYLAVYWALAAGATAALGGALGSGAVWLAPAFWVTAELGRTHLLSGFPWGLLGYVPYRRLSLIQGAAWTGVYGVSALLVLVNAAIAYVALARTRGLALLGLGAAGLVLSAASILGHAHLRAPSPSGATLPVALIQGNIDQGVTANPTSARDRLRIYGDLSRRAAPGVRLVVWPEGAVPVDRGEEPAMLASLTRLAATVDRPLLVGTSDAVPAGAPGERSRSPFEASASQPEARYLNTALLVSGSGVSARYDKMHLVPFGEYVPLKRLLLFVDAVATELRDVSPGRTTTVFPLAGAPFGTVICYEVIFPSLFRRFVAEGATFMLNLTNDAWVGDSSGPLQHLAMVPLRAVENRVAVGRAANTGVSALVAPSGAIVEALPLGRRGSLHVEVPLSTGGTFYTRHGDLFAHAMSAVSATALAAIAVPTRVARLRRRGR